MSFGLQFLMVEYIVKKKDSLKSNFHCNIYIKEQISIVVE